MPCHDQRSQTPTTLDPFSGADQDVRTDFGSNSECAALMERADGAQSRMLEAGGTGPMGEYAHELAMQGSETERQSRHFEDHTGRDFSVWANEGEVQVAGYYSDNPADYGVNMSDEGELKADFWDSSQSAHASYAASQGSNRTQHMLIEELGYSPEEADCYLQEHGRNAFRNLMVVMSRVRVQDEDGGLSYGNNDALESVFPSPGDPASCLGPNEYADGLGEDGWDRARGAANEQFPTLELGGWFSEGDTFSDPIEHQSDVRTYPSTTE
jgi:hypothetical protein